jgi:signal transduction histidine kinase
MLRRLIGKDVQLAKVLEARLRHVKINPGQIEQVIMNLAVNARDAMHQVSVKSPRGRFLDVLLHIITTQRGHGMTCQPDSHLVAEQMVKYIKSVLTRTCETTPD